MSSAITVANAPATAGATAAVARAGAFAEPLTPIFGAPLWTVHPSNNQFKPDRNLSLEDDVWHSNPFVHFTVQVPRTDDEDE